MPTIPTPQQTDETQALTLDELVALRLTASQLDVVYAYQTLCGGSIVSWVAKMQVAS
jgi:hypothetical protein